VSHGVGVAVSRVYIHELIDVIGHNRARYMQHMTANWGPIGRAERGQRCFGVWATVGSTGRWPQVVNLWEYESWEALGNNFEVELTGSGLQDPSLESWWAEAAAFRSGGLDRIMVAPDWSPSVDEHCAGPGLPAVGYLHETITTGPGGAGPLLESFRAAGRDAMAAHGLGLVAALATAMANDHEVIMIWSIPDWGTWAAFESSHADPGSAIRAFRNSVPQTPLGWSRNLMADAPLSPLRTGRQPQVEDRRPVDDR